MLRGVADMGTPTERAVWLLQKGEVRDENPAIFAALPISYAGLVIGAAMAVQVTVSGLPNAAEPWSIITGQSSFDHDLLAILASPQQPWRYNIAQYAPCLPLS